MPKHPKGYGTDACASETRAKIAEAQRGEKAYQWSGEAVGIYGAHKRHRAALPPFCEQCGCTAAERRLDAALRPDVPPERMLGSVKLKRLYSTHTEDYQRLCRSCHNKQHGRVPPPETRKNRQRALART